MVEKFPAPRNFEPRRCCQVISLVLQSRIRSNWLCSFLHPHLVSTCSVCVPKASYSMLGDCQNALTSLVHSPAMQRPSLYLAT